MKTVFHDTIAFGHFTLIFIGKLLGASTNKIPYENKLLKYRFAPVCPSSRLDPLFIWFRFLCVQRTTNVCPDTWSTFLGYSWFLVDLGPPFLEGVSFYKNSFWKSYLPIMTLPRPPGTWEWHFRWLQRHRTSWRMHTRWNNETILKWRLVLMFVWKACFCAFFLFLSLENNGILASF